MIKGFLVLLSTMIITMGGQTLAVLEDAEEDKTGIIFLGDSRFVGIDNVVEQDDNVFFVAKVGQGLDWLKSTGKYKVDEIMDSHNEYTEWKIVTGLGVNDLGNCLAYRDYYNELLEDDWSDVTFYYSSVNPVDESKTGIINKRIQKFNEVFSDEENYIDVYPYVLENMSTNDGVHYNHSLNRGIYKEILSGLEE